MDKEAIKEMQRQIASASLIKPGPNQHPGRCGFSRTGWAVWDNSGGCTCKPCEAPKQ